jgi:hypothetical protein
MLKSLWSNAQQDPLLAIAVGIISLCGVWVLALAVQLLVEARRAGETTADLLRQDAAMADRRARLHHFQARRPGPRDAS